MHDIKFIKNNPEAFDESLTNRNLQPLSNKIISIHNEYLRSLSKKENLQKKRNEITKKIAQLSKNNNISEVNNLKKKIFEIKDNIQDCEKKTKDYFFNLNSILLNIPNTIDDKVPIGKSEKDNVIVKENGKKKFFNFEPKNHIELAENLDLIDYDKAQKLSGAKFSVLKRDLAHLHRALVNYMLFNHTNKNKYEETVVPELVKTETLIGTGQLPKFSNDLFQTTNDLWLIPTSEVCLTNLNREEILISDSLPLRYTSFTNCFRLEAGAAGKDTKGLIREHQFGKVELVSVTLPEKSSSELERMCKCVEGILQELDLNYRIISLCSGDIGFSSSLTYDFEVWMPGQNKYVEVSSCSNCNDFQSRRMKMRIKNKVDNKIFYPHTLNGSGLAVGRMLVAILENYQNEDGSIEIPKILQPYIGGKKSIEKKSL